MNDIEVLKQQLKNFMKEKIQNFVANLPHHLQKTGICEPNRRASRKVMEKKWKELCIYREHGIDMMQKNIVLSSVSKKDLRGFVEFVDQQLCYPYRQMMFKWQEWLEKTIGVVLPGIDLDRPINIPLDVASESPSSFLSAYCMTASALQKCLPSAFLCGEDVYSVSRFILLLLNSDFVVEIHQNQLDGSDRLSLSLHQENWRQPLVLPVTFGVGRGYLEKLPRFQFLSYEYDLGSLKYIRGNVFSVLRSVFSFNTNLFQLRKELPSII